MTVAGVSAGLTVVSIVTVPLAALSRGVAFGTGWASTLTECAVTGSLTSFSCAKGLALGAFESFAGGRIEGRISSLVEGTTLKVAPEEVGKFGDGTFEIYARHFSSYRPSKEVALGFLIGLGGISFLICLMGYRSWTRPKRPYPITGYAKGAVVGYQFGMGMSLLIIVAGIIVGIAKLF